LPRSPCVCKRPLQAPPRHSRYQGPADKRFARYGVSTAVMRAWNIDGASIMTAPTGGRLASPKVSKKQGMQVARRHRFFERAMYGLHCKGVTARVARADPAGRGEPERLKDCIRLTLTVGNDQHHILVDWSRVDRLPSKLFREHAFLLLSLPWRGFENRTVAPM
jgi:hypothetical protein